jgi:hypothetical protein
MIHWTAATCSAESWPGKSFGPLSRSVASRSALLACPTRFAGTNDLCDAGAHSDKVPIQHGKNWIVLLTLAFII